MALTTSSAASSASSSAQQRMIIWTSVLVLLVGATGLAFMLQPPQTQVSRAGGTERAPASIAKKSLAQLSDGGNFSSISLGDRDQNMAIDVDLPCEKSRQATTEKNYFSQAVHQVRLSGTNCNNKDELVSSEIRNLSNGFSATVFYPTEKTFTTDYITLAKGQNRLHIVHIYKKGQRTEREYLIERR